MPYFYREHADCRRETGHDTIAHHLPAVHTPPGNAPPDELTSRIPDVRTAPPGTISPAP